jgi:hypothetical protein
MQTGTEVGPLLYGNDQQTWDPGNARPAKRADWRTRPLPKKRTIIRLDRVCNETEILKIRIGFIPEDMDDKWFIFYEKDKLYFHRSWTGICIYVVKFAEESGRFRMIEAEVNRDSRQYKGTSEEYDRRLILELIDIHFLH